jgi:hypothetical protein
LEAAPGIEPGYRDLQLPTQASGPFPYGPLVSFDPPPDRLPSNNRFGRVAPRARWPGSTSAHTRHSHGEGTSDPTADAVVVVRMDRLGRDAAEQLAILKRVRTGKVGLVAIAQAIDLATPQRRAMAQIGAVFAELERSLISERTTETLAELVSRSAHGTTRRSDGTPTTTATSWRTTTSRPPSVGSATSAPRT